MDFLFGKVPNLTPENYLSVQPIRVRDEGRVGEEGDGVRSSFLTKSEELVQLSP